MNQTEARDLEWSCQTVSAMNEPCDSVATFHCVDRWGEIGIEQPLNVESIQRNPAGAEIVESAKHSLDGLEAGFCGCRIHGDLLD